MIKMSAEGMNTKKITAVFIVNAISGGRDKTPVLEQIKKHLSDDIVYEIIHWNAPQQIDEILKKVKTGNHDIVVAVGVDGTINKVASALVNTNKKLGIIPAGSGNGLARHLQIPLNVKVAIDVINKGKSICIDSCNLNGVFFGCTSGVGFDAYIGKLFANSTTRGFFTYFKLILTEFIRYKSQDYKLFIDGKTINTKAFLITVANASQYGNNAYIAPKADIQDGMMNVCILKPFPLFSAIGLGRKIFNKTIDNSSYVETYTAKEVMIERNNSGPVHYDGEPHEMDKLLKYEIAPASLYVLIP